METCEFIIHGKELRSFVKKYQPSHLNEISSDGDILLKIIYEKTNKKITRFHDIQTKTLSDSDRHYFNAFFAYTLIRYVIPSFYGLESNPKKFASSEKKAMIPETQFKIIAHLKENNLLTHPIPENKFKSAALLNQSLEYKISSEEMTLLPAIHALELNIKIYEEDAQKRYYKQSHQRVTSIRTMRAFLNDMKKHLISRKIELAKLIEIFIHALRTEIFLTRKDHEKKSHLGIFFKWHTPKLVEIYQETLTFLLDGPSISNKIKNTR